MPHKAQDIYFGSLQNESANLLFIKSPMGRINKSIREKHSSGPESNCCDFQISRLGLDREGKPTKQRPSAKETGREELPSQVGKGYGDTWDWVGRSPHQLPLSILILCSVAEVLWWGGGQGVGGRLCECTRGDLSTGPCGLWLGMGMSVEELGGDKWNDSKQWPRWLQVSQFWLQCLLSCCCPASKNTFA